MTLKARWVLRQHYSTLWSRMFWTLHTLERWVIDLLNWLIDRVTFGTLSVASQQQREALYIHLTKYCLNARTSISVIIVQSGQCCSIKKPSCSFSTETVFADVFSASLIASYDLIPLPVSLLDLVSIEKIYQKIETMHFQHLLYQTFPIISRFVKNTPLSVVFSILLLVFRIVMKHSLCTLIFRLDVVNLRYFRMLISIYKCSDYLIEKISFLQKQKDAAIVTTYVA